VASVVDIVGISSIFMEMPMYSHQTKSIQELVINWHITEVCNYRCQYCYAKWEKQDTELIHDNEKIRRLLESVYQYFNEHKATNGFAFDSLRLNLAGGEPLLYPGKALRVIELARQLGFKTSVITNGSRLNEPLMQSLAPHLSVLGISLDSAEVKFNHEIGRADRHGRVVNFGKLAKTLEAGRWLNPSLQLKINTVVNAINWREDMSRTIADFAPDRWKIFRMLPTVTDALSTSADEFAAFVQRHRPLGNVIQVEDNADMTESYIMIDPHGRFFQNTDGGKGYQYSQPILEVGADAAFSQVTWSSDKFCARYSHEQKGGA
jgi:radical S-adenosyl methionine domain-containing protein 2